MSKIKTMWKDFWFRWIHSGPIVLGGRARGYYEFRTQRLVNIILIIITLIILLS